MVTISSYEPYEQAMMDYFKGEKDNLISIIREDGFENKIPVSFLYGNSERFSLIDDKALSMCRGRVLDVGAGSGNHSLFLQQEGFEVYALEILPALIKILRLRGLSNVMESDVIQLENGNFDTVVMLGHGLGIAQDLSGLNALLQKLKSLITREGYILCDSLDVTKTDIPENLEYQKHIERLGRYRGEIRFRFKYKDSAGSLIKWLHVDLDTLSEVAFRNDMLCKLVYTDLDGNYLAQLKLK
jgi:SAM-dependent methyltransferase